MCRGSSGNRTTSKDANSHLGRWPSAGMLTGLGPPQPKTVFGRCYDAPGVAPGRARCFGWDCSGCGSDGLNVLLPSVRLGGCLDHRVASHEEGSHVAREKEETGEAAE